MTPSLQDLAETEYHSVRDPRHTRRARFGEYVTLPSFPTRHDAHKLLDARCRPHELTDLLAEVESVYAPLNVPFRCITAHDPSTITLLNDALPQHGYAPRWCYIATWSGTSDREPNPAVDVRAVPFDHPHLDLIVGENDGPDNGLAIRRHHDPRLGGEVLVAYLEGEPAGTAGWFVTPQNVARFRGIDTRPAFRNRGVATTLIHYVQHHPRVRAARALALFCGDEGPWPLYQRLGFVERARGWWWIRKLDNPA